MVPQDKVKRRMDGLSVCHFYCLENFPAVLDESDNYVGDKWMELFLNLRDVPRQPVLIVNRDVNNLLRPPTDVLSIILQFSSALKYFLFKFHYSFKGFLGRKVSRKSSFHALPFRESRRRDLTYSIFQVGRRQVPPAVKV